MEYDAQLRARLSFQRTVVRICSRTARVDQHADDIRFPGATATITDSENSQ